MQLSSNIINMWSTDLHQQLHQTQWYYLNMRFHQLLVSYLNNDCISPSVRSHLNSICINHSIDQYLNSNKWINPSAVLYLRNNEPPKPERLPSVERH